MGARLCQLMIFRRNFGRAVFQAALQTGVFHLR
jgi:hypothetical protein